MARWCKGILNCNVHFLPPREDLVFIAGNLKTLSRLLHAHNGYIGQPDLIGWSENGSRHRCTTQGMSTSCLAAPGTRATDRSFLLLHNAINLRGCPYN